MPTTRPYRRTSLLLKGCTPGILTLEQQGALSYALQGAHLPQGAVLLLFFRGQPPIRATAARGSLPACSIDDWQGAALCSAEQIHAQAQAAGFDVSAACRQYWDVQETRRQAAADSGKAMDTPVQPDASPFDAKPNLSAVASASQNPTQRAVSSETSSASMPSASADGIAVSSQASVTTAQPAETTAPSPASPAAEALAASPCAASAAPLPDPFGGRIKNAVWKRISYPYFANGSHYLSGEILCEGRTAVRLLAIPGEYAVSPPAWLAGFDCFWQSPLSRQGYWLFACDSATGQPVSIRSLCVYPAPGGCPPAASAPPGKHSSSAASAPPPAPR